MATTSLTATIQPSGTIFIQRAGLVIARLVKQQTPDGHYWKTLMNSSNAGNSRKEYKTAASAAMARWGAEGRDAVRAAQDALTAQAA